VHLGFERFTLAGHDWGGVIAWHFAIAHPEMLDKLVAINAPHPSIFARELADNPEQRRSSAYFQLFCTPAAEGVLSQNEFAMMRQVIFAGGWSTPADEEKYLECWHRGLTGALNYYRAAALGAILGGGISRTQRFSPPRTRLSVPTLVIWGEKDIALTTGNLNGLDEYVENIQIQRLPQAGHFVQHEQPAQVTDAIRKFLE
jgi:epoxide hydrolase 4